MMVTFGLIGQAELFFSIFQSPSGLFNEAATKVRVVHDFLKDLLLVLPVDKVELFLHVLRERLHPRRRCFALL